MLKWKPGSLPVGLQLSRPAQHQVNLQGRFANPPGAFLSSTASAASPSFSWFSTTLSVFLVVERSHRFVDFSPSAGLAWIFSLCSLAF